LSLFSKRSIFLSRLKKRVHFCRVPKELTLKIWNERKQNSLPKLWSTALIKLLHKGGEPTEPKNYRPVSLLCVSRTKRIHEESSIE